MTPDSPPRPRGPSLRFCARPAAAVLLGLAALDARPSAQAAGNESGAMISQGVASLGGRSLTPSGNQAYSALGQAGTGVESSSSLFRLRDSVAWTEPSITTNQPIIFATRPMSGDKDGGEVVLALGFNFQAAGGGTPTFTFGGTAGTGTLVVSNVEARVTTPAGVNGFGNPLGLTELAVSNLIGSHAEPERFGYLPALWQTSPAQVGQEFGIGIEGTPNAFISLFTGNIQAGTANPQPPFDGASEIITQLIFLLQNQPVPTGTFSGALKVPNDPNLAGQTLYFQVLEVIDPMTGSFSNLLSVLVHP